VNPFRPTAPFGGRPPAAATRRCLVVHVTLMASVRDWHPFAAGLTAGACNVLVGHPLDTLKVRVQTCGSLPDGAPGYRSLLAGIRGPLLTTPFIGGLNFGLYDTIRNRLAASFPSLCVGVGDAGFGDAPLSPNMLNIFVSGTLGGFAVCHITCPMNNVKVQQQTMQAGQSVGLKEAAFRVGVRGLFKGYMPHAVMESFGRGFYMVGFELSKKCLGVDARGGGGAMDLPKRIVCGSIGGAVAWLAVYPVDTLRSRLMRDWQGTKYVDTWDCLSKTLREEGLRGLYRGLSYSLLRAVPVAGVTLTIFDLMLNALRS